jgi:hypothetical protein
MKDKKGGDVIEIEEDEYIINADISKRDTDLKIMMCLYKMGEDACAIEFKKIEGDFKTYSETT